MTPRSLILWLLILLVSAAAVWTAFRLDRPVREAVVAGQGKGWKKSADYKFHSAVREYGDWPELMLAGGIGLLLARWMRSTRWTSIIAAAMLASTLAGILANSARLTTGRTRPRESPKIEQAFHGPWHQGRLTIGDSRFNSFPSGHTATAFGFAGVILFASPWIGIGAIIVAGAIAWSSIAIGAHHPSDVTVSVILSLIVAWFTWRWMRRHGARTWESLRQHVLRLIRRPQ